MNNTIYDKPEDTDGYKGLHGEVVTCDIYKLKQLPFVPDVIIDIGSNIGIFTRFAREIFPNALIIAVEPNPTNMAHFAKFTPYDEKIIAYHMAIGIGQVWHGKYPTNGGGEVYLSEGLGYPTEQMAIDDRMEKSEIETIMPYDLIKKHVKKGQKFIVKIDCEGAENTIFTHAPSLDAIKKADYVAIELHYFASTGKEQTEVNEVTEATLKSFEKDFKCSREHVMYYAMANKHAFEMPIISPEIEAQ